MLSWEEWMEAKSLLAQGCSIREVARLTGYSRNTVAKLGEHGPPCPIGRRRASQLHSHKKYLGPNQDCPRGDAPRSWAIGFQPSVRPQGPRPGAEAPRD
jgi:hypothetical protein